MSDIFLRQPEPEDEEAFLSATQKSQALHQPWVKPPLTPQEFADYIQRYRLPDQKSYLLCQSGHILGVFNISEIVRGLFQNAFLGFYAMADYAGKGWMSAGLKLVLEKAFRELALHRLEANIQPENTSSIRLVRKQGFRYEGFSPRYLKINNEWRGHEHWAITYEDYIRDDAEVIKQDHVGLVDYQPEWPLEAKREIERLKTVLPANCIIDIQHVGSTAIPGLPAKPIIDIMIAVTSLAEMKALAVPVLQKLGYEYWDANPDTERMFFVKGMPPYGEKRTHHVHIVEPSSKHWTGKIAFRDYLIAHPEAAREYQELKDRLAREFTYDREQYTDAKGEFVQRILKLAKDG